MTKRWQEDEVERDRGSPSPAPEATPRRARSRMFPIAASVLLLMGVAGLFVQTSITTMNRAPGVRPAPPAPAPPPPPPAPMKKQIVLRSISFDSGAAQLRPDAQPLLAELLRTLKDDPGFAISIEGHADSSEGSDDARAEAIALRRARVVREYLVANGIAASRIEVKAYGESRPIASNDTPDGRAQNRRVEFAYR